MEETNDDMTNDEGMSNKERYDLKKEKREEEREKSRKGKERKKKVSWVVPTLLLLVGIVLIVFFAGKSSQSETGTLTHPLSAQTDWILGDPDAKVSLVEYSDFECPACGATFPIVKRILTEFGGDIAFAYRHFPLTTIHQRAETAAVVAEAAGKQGKFFEMHDLLFLNQEVWTRSPQPEAQYLEYALTIGLDLELFEADLTDSSELLNNIRDDVRGANTSGVNSTPTFFINNEPVSFRSYEDMRELIIDALAEQTDRDDLGTV